MTASSDSILTTSATRQLDFFSTPVEVDNAYEQWVIAYVMNPLSRSFYEAWIGLVVDAVGRPPLRLVLDDLAQVPLHAPLPPKFTGASDDLDLGDEGDRGAGEAAG